MSRHTQKQTVVKSMDTKIRMVVARGWGEGNGELFNGCKVSAVLRSSGVEW